MKEILSVAAVLAIGGKWMVNTHALQELLEKDQKICYDILIRPTFIIPVLYLDLQETGRS